MLLPEVHEVLHMLLPEVHETEVLHVASIDVRGHFLEVIFFSKLSSVKGHLPLDIVFQWW